MPALLYSLVMLIAWAPLVPASEIVLAQADGGTLQLPQPAIRLITLSPHLAEGVFAAGAGQRLVATVEYSEFPAAAADLPRIGDAFRLDIERIVALRPDLVVAWDSGNPTPALQQLRSFGIRVWTVEIREPLEIPSFIEAVGRATGGQAAAARLAEELRQRIVDLAGRYAEAPPRRYFYQVDAKPLFTINGQHLISRGLALCGGVNIFADESSLAFQVAREAVVVANPDFMLAPTLPGDGNPLADWLDWPKLAAVQNRRLLLLPADEISRATPRFVDVLEQTCAQVNGSNAVVANE